MIRPNNIPGLKIWLDASDASTVNNGIISDVDMGASFHANIPKQTVSSIVDKMNGYVFTNPSGMTGPAYIFNALNGKNAIYFPYYPPTYTLPSSLSTLPPFSITEKALIATGVTALSTGTYSLYYVFKPNDIRGVTGSKDIWAFTIWNGDVVPTVTSTSSLLSSIYPDRGLKMTGIAGTASIPAIWNSIKSSKFNDNQQIVYHETENNSYVPSTLLTDPNGVSNIGAFKGRYYQYGKTQINGIRSSENLKKFTLIRRDFNTIDNFLPRSSKQTSNVITVNDPIMVIGSYWPGRSGLGITISRTEQDFLSPFEGYFCEFLFFDRTLSESESNSVEDYLKNKWIPTEEEEVPSEGLVLYLDPSKKECYPGTGLRVFDLSDNRLIGTISGTGTMSVDYGTWSGVFVSDPSPIPNLSYSVGRGKKIEFQTDLRSQNYYTTGWTTNIWFMPRYSDGEWYNRIFGTSSTYPSDRGCRPFSLLTNRSGTGYNSQFIVGKMGWTARVTDQYDPITNAGGWDVYQYPYFPYYDLSVFVSGTFSSNTLVPRELENNTWHLFTFVFSRNPALSTGYPISLYFNGILISSKNGGQPAWQNPNLTYPLNGTWTLGGQNDYGLYGTSKTDSIKGYYGISTVYNRNFSDVEVMDYYNRTKKRYGIE